MKQKSDLIFGNEKSLICVLQVFFQFKHIFLLKSTGLDNVFLLISGIDKFYYKIW